MNDLITYVPSLSALYAEGVAIAKDLDHPLNAYFTVDDDKSELTFNCGKTPVHYHEGSTMSVCDGRAIPRELVAQVASIEVLGEVDASGEFVFDSDESQATYEAALGEREIAFTDEEGVKHTYNKPYKIGVIAR